MRWQTVYTEITNRCNLNCATCYNRSGRNRETREMTIDQIEHIINLGSRYGANRFLFSGGEPSLHTHFHELLRLIDKNSQFQYGFVTNGTVHDEYWIDFLNSHENITVQISLDGASEESNCLTRGANSFERAVDFVRKLNLPTQKPLLKMVVSQRNLDDVEAFYRFAVSLNCIPEIAYIYNSGNASDDWENKALSAQQKLAVLRMVNHLNAEFGIEAFLPMCTVHCPFSVGAERMSICIKTDGRIQPCQVLYSNEFSIGNAFDFSEQEVFSHVDALVELGKKRLTMDYNCEKCMLRTGCGKGCLAEAVNNFGDPLAEDGNCLFRKLQFLDMYVSK